MKIINKLVLIIFNFNFNLLKANENYVYVDTNILVNSSDAGKSISLEIEKLHKKTIEKLKEIEKELKNGETEIINQKNVISKEEFDKRLTELRVKAKDYQKQRNDNAKILSQKRIKANEKLLSLIQPILTEYADANTDLSDSTFATQQYVTNLTSGIQYKWIPANSMWVKSYEGFYEPGTWSITF